MIGKLESRIRDLILKKYPDYEGSPGAEVLITFRIQGSFHAYLKHGGEDPESRRRTVSLIASLVKRLQPFPALPDENAPDKS